jgi:Flp pilus assembly protein TadB
VAAVAALALLPLPWSVAVAAGAAAAALRFLPTGFTREDERLALVLARAIPESVDLLAAVLRAGITDAVALDLVATAAPPPLRGHLSAVATHRRLGAAPAAAWRVVADVPALGELATAMARHAETGSPIAALLDRVAADARRDYYTQAQAAARAAAVRAVIPLAACFLPAFVLLGVVPIVASLVSGLTF